jgi:hypothetical protein
MSKTMIRCIKLAIVAVVIASCGSLAHAARVQQNVASGKWCSYPDSGEGPTSYVSYPSGHCKEDNWIEIKPSSYEGHEMGCNFTSVKTWFDPNIVRNTKEMGVRVAQISAQCGGEGCTWRQTFIMYVSKGTLYMQQLSRSQDKCEG